MILYDMHIHYAKKEDIDEILGAVNMLGLKLVGLVTHHRTNVRKYIDLDYDIEVLWGIEMKYPFPSKPKDYDFVLVHMQDMEVTPEIIRRMKGDIIAHPTAYNVIWSEEALEELKSKEILVEFNASHYKSRDERFYKELIKRGIEIIYGSDAHSVDEIYSSPHPSYVIPLERVRERFSRK